MYQQVIFYLDILISNLNNEKQKWNEERKAQNELLQKYKELLSSLSEEKKLDFPHLYDNNNNSLNLELNNLIIYNSKISEIESEERILEQEKAYFEQYKSNFNNIYDQKEKDIERLKAEYENEKNELEKRLELLEVEEKLLNDKYNNFEKEKSIMTNRYNEAMKKEAALNQAKLRVENFIKELDIRNYNIEKNMRIIGDNKKRVENLKMENDLEERKILDEKNNLNLRQNMIDSLRMKYVGDITDYPFYSEEKINKDKYNIYDRNVFPSTINQNLDNIKSGFNFGNNDFKKNDANDMFIKSNFYENYNNENKKLSIINEEEKISKNHSNKYE